jgi:hypothetical protein
MTNAEVCAQISEGEPTISLDALAQLRSFLDALLRDQASTADSAGAQESLGTDPPGSSTQSETESRWEAPE